MQMGYKEGQADTNRREAQQILPGSFLFFKNALTRSPKQTGQTLNVSSTAVVELFMKGHCVLNQSDAAAD